MTNYDCDNCGAKGAKLYRTHMCPLPKEWEQILQDTWGEKPGVTMYKEIIGKNYDGTGFEKIGISEHRTDEYDNPAGGNSSAVGVNISWQDGPLGEDGEQNGAFVEHVLELLIDRMQFYQEGKFSCRENALVITKLKEARHWMWERRDDRKKRGVLGKHED